MEAKRLNTNQSGCSESFPLTGFPGMTSGFDSLRRCCDKCSFLGYCDGCYGYCDGCHDEFIVSPLSTPIFAQFSPFSPNFRHFRPFSPISPLSTLPPWFFSCIMLGYYCLCLLIKFLIMFCKKTRFVQLIFQTF